MQTAFKNIDDYIAAQPVAIRESLEKLRLTIQKAAPMAEEVISYGMPAFKYQGMLVYFAANKQHIGFYPTGSGITAFKKELGAYPGSKGAVRFPFGEPIPFALIAKIVRFRVNYNIEKAAGKNKAVKTEAATKKNIKTCPAGHTYYKSSECPTCSQCENLRKPNDGFLELLSAPARRALERIGVKSAEQLAAHTEKEIMALHGMGPASLPKLKQALKAKKLTFKKS